MWLASACQWIHYDPLVIFFWAHASLWDKHLAHPWMYLSTWANTGQGCCDEMSVPRTGHRCSQRGQMGFDLSLQIWLHASLPQPAASDQSGRAMIPTYIFWLASLVLTIQMVYIYIYICIYTAIYRWACIVIYSHRCSAFTSPQADKLGIFKFTSSCPEDATFDLLKGFSNPEQVVNTRPSATRPGRPKLFVLSSCLGHLCEICGKMKNIENPGRFCLNWQLDSNFQLAKWRRSTDFDGFARGAPVWPWAQISDGLSQYLMQCLCHLRGVLHQAAFHGDIEVVVSTNEKHQKAELVTIVYLLHFNVFHL